MDRPIIKEEEIDDPVIQQMPIYLSKGLLEKLYVFQYPLKSTTIPIDQTVLSSRIKPKLQEVELEVQLPTRNRNYDKSKGEQIVLNCDGMNKHNNPDDENFFSGDIMDKIIYTSTRGQLDPRRYAIGILYKNELHLNPVHGILHVKPAFQYLDKSDKNLKKSGLKDTAEPDSEEEEDQPQQVTVKVGRTESERLKKAREKSFGFLQKKNAEEAWIPTEFCPFGSEKSMMERNQLLTSYPNENVSVLTLSKEKYLASLITQTVETDPKSSEVMSMYHIKSLPLGEQVRLLMLNVRLISFARLCETLGVTGDSQQQQLLRSIQQVASLIQGNWVVKSEVLYPKDKMCGVTGVNHEIITKARDYVLQQFTTSRFVNRKVVTQATRISTEDMKDILEKLAIFRPPDKWEFALPFDETIVSKYPDVAQRQEMMWKVKLQQAQSQQGDFKTPKREPGDSPAAKQSRRTRRRSRQDSCSSDSGSENKK